MPKNTRNREEWLQDIWGAYTTGSQAAFDRACAAMKREVSKRDEQAILGRIGQWAADKARRDLEGLR